MYSNLMSMFDIYRKAIKFYESHMSFIFGNDFQFCLQYLKAFKLLTLKYFKCVLSWKEA